MPEVLLIHAAIYSPVAEQHIELQFADGAEDVGTCVHVEPLLVLV
jgi:hypothetical protein